MQFHACFGATRQVEVLRDVLLHLLNDPGSDLGEDDILVVCPAIEAFAPLIQAVFGPSAEIVGTGAANDRRPLGAHRHCGTGSPTSRSGPPTRC